MPFRLERGWLHRLADLEVRQPPLALVGVGRLVAAGLVREQEAREGDHRAGRAELGVLARGVVTPSRILTVWPDASFICEAIVRFQISS